MESDKPLVIKLTPIKHDPIDPEELAAKVAFHYNYTFKQALKLSHKDAMILSTVANKELNSNYYNLSLAAISPHADKSVRKKILDGFKKGAK